MDDAFGMLHLIEETDGKDSRLVGGHIADLVNVDVDLGVLQAERSSRNGHLGYIVIRTVG